MSEKNAATPPDAETSSSPAKALEVKPPVEAKHIYLISYPKIVFLYPTFFAALLAGLIIYFGGEVDVITAAQEKSRL
jgi:hypothetical protein